MIKNSPDWVSESIFYHIYPLGYCGVSWDRIHPDSGEKLSRIKNGINYLKNMGFNAVYLGPVFQSDTHGYDTVDYFRVDDRLGSNADMKELIKEFHDNGIKVVFDGVFNHTSRNFFAFRELVNLNGYGEYENWYCNIQHYDSGKGLPFTYECWGGHETLPKLNLKNHDVKNHLFEAVKFWIREFDIDGIRLDAADCLDFDFMKELKDVTDSVKGNFWLMGEIIHGDYRRWANSHTLNSVTNYECYKGLYSSFNDTNFFEIAYALNRQFSNGGLYEDLFLYNFVDNHDVSRIHSILKNKIHIHPLHILLFTIPGIPSIYYGSEYGIEGVKQNHSDWNLRPDINAVIGYENVNKNDIADTVKKLADIRKNNTALKKGTYRQLHVGHEQFVFEREFYGEKMVVGVNSSCSTFRGNVKSIENGIYFDVLNGMKEFRCENGNLAYEIHPNWGMMLIKR